MEASNWVDLTQWSALVGFLTPLVVAFLKQSGLSKMWNTVIAVAFSIVAAFITTMQAGELSWDTWATSFITLYTVAVATYYGLWKPIGVEEPLQASTSFKK